MGVGLILTIIQNLSLNQDLKKNYTASEFSFSCVTICSHLSARHERNRKLLRLRRMTELVVDDTPSPPVTGSCVCVCPFTAGITGQDWMWSEAGRQLVEWDASVAGGYKVSFQKGIPETTLFPLNTQRLCCASFALKAACKMNGLSTQRGSKQPPKMPRAQCWNQHKKYTHQVLGVNALQLQCTR